MDSRVKASLGLEDEGSQLVTHAEMVLRYLHQSTPWPSTALSTS